MAAPNLRDNFGIFIFKGFSQPTEACSRRMCREAEENTTTLCHKSSKRNTFYSQLKQIDYHYRFNIVKCSREDQVRRGGFCNSHSCEVNISRFDNSRQSEFATGKDLLSLHSW